MCGKEWIRVERNYYINDKKMQIYLIVSLTIVEKILNVLCEMKSVHRWRKSKEFLQIFEYVLSEGLYI